MLKNSLFLFVGIVIVSMLSLGGSYSPPTFDSVNFSLCSGYTAPSLESINFTLGESDSCITDTCTYTSGDWDILFDDNCVITSNVDVGGNDISITGTGTFLTTANITGYNLLHISGDGDPENAVATCRDGGCFHE